MQKNRMVQFRYGIGLIYVHIQSPANMIMKYSTKKKLGGLVERHTDIFKGERRFIVIMIN